MSCLQDRRKESETPLEAGQAEHVIYKTSSHASPGAVHFPYPDRRQSQLRGMHAWHGVRANLQQRSSHAEHIRRYAKNGFDFLEG
jgi:hypothetical protein